MGAIQGNSKSGKAAQPAGRKPGGARAPVRAGRAPGAPAAPAPLREPGPGWREAIERTVGALGYEVVDVERAARGLLRIFIDRVPGRAYPTGESEFVLVEDCETVTRQLQYALEVDGIDYTRLEVSSPGLDRPLRHAADYSRFAGEPVAITLKQPFQGRKVFKGRLQAGADGAWTLLLDDGKNEQVLAFTLDEVREARLVPVLNFKGRQAKQAGASQAPAEVDGGQGR